MNNGFLQESPTSLLTSKDWAIWPNLLLFQSLKTDSKIITSEINMNYYEYIHHFGDEREHMSSMN